MKRFFLIVCLLASVSAVFAQTQQGYVKTRGRLTANGTTIPGTRLSGVTLTLRGNNSVVSGNNGAFSFSVPCKMFCVAKVQKNGYQLYDRDLLGKTYYYSSNDLLVVMDTPDNVLADKLASERKIRRTMQKQLTEKEDEIEALKEQQKITEEQYQKQLQALYQSQENNEKLISEMAERYSTLDFDQLDDFQRRVAAFIQNGELTRADSLLNTKGSMEERSAELDRESSAIKDNAEELKRRQEEQSKSEALYAQKLEDFAADCYSRFEICKLRHDIDSAAYWLELRVSKDTTNVKWLQEVGDFIRVYISDYNRALQYFYRALDSAIAQEGEKGMNVALNYNLIGLVYSSQGDYSASLEMYQKSLKIYLSIFGENHPAVAASYNNIGYYYFSQGDYSAALEMYQKSLKIRMETFGDCHPDVAQSYNNLGLIYNEQGNYSASLEMYQKSLKIRMFILGDSHPLVAVCYNNMGLVYYDQGYYPAALEMYRNALNIVLEFFGDSHPLVATIYNNIGSVYRGQNDFPEALEMYQNSLRIFRKIYGDNHPDIGTYYSNIGGVYGDLGDYFKALEMLQKGLNILLENFGENHPKVASNYSHIGSLYTKQGDYTKALEMYQKFMSINSKVYGETHPFATNFNRIGEIYYSAKAQGVELSGFKEFIQSVAFVGITIGNDTPAFKKGLSGEYYVLELADWSMDSDTNLITKIVQLQSDPKTIVVMKENKISQFHFENTMGIGFSLRKVGVDEKQRIIKAYRKWKEKQQVQ